MGALLLLAGCGPRFEAYRYLSLEGYPDARVVERARATPGEHRFFVGEIPTRYEIARESYTLVLTVDPGEWGPAIDLGVRPYPERRIGFRSGAERLPPGCAEWAPADRTPGGWLYRFRWCDGHDPWGKTHNHLRFVVLDPDGNVVGDEDIPYTIERDGFFIYIDAI